MFKKLFLVFMLLALSLANASDYMKTYRVDGIKSVEKELKKDIISSEYWSEYFKDIDVRYGYYESMDYVLVANKEKKRLQAYKINNKKMTKFFDEKVLVGKNKGDKQYEGDLKTPTGAYFFRHIRTDMGQFYGPLALVTDYPNLYDRLQKKDGYGIWLHGLPMDKREKREEFTQGCIALDNNRLVDLEKSINYEKALILIDDDRLKQVSSSEMGEIFAFIFKWRRAWIESDINEYLGYYSDEFKKLSGATLEQFKTHKKRIFAKKESKKIKFTNINIYPYPNSKDKRMFRVIMDEDYWSTNFTFEGKKELFLELKNNKVTILAEG